jgi:adenosylcobinamide kinase/adenosylcobinamide-phosphate guanylyltransferase
VLFVATAETIDQEMRQRIALHRKTRPRDWKTLEAHQEVAKRVRRFKGQVEVILVDCLTLLVANLLEKRGRHLRATIDREVEELLDLRGRGHLLLVSNEVGMGLVPPFPSGRRYRDLLGEIHQRVAQEADEVYLLVAGIPLPLKGGEKIQW